MFKHVKIGKMVWIIFCKRFCYELGGVEAVRVLVKWVDLVGCVLRLFLNVYLVGWFVEIVMECWWNEVWKHDLLRLLLNVVEV